MFFKENDGPKLARVEPTRRERIQREEQRVNDELIRVVMQAASASEALREEA